MRALKVLFLAISLLMLTCSAAQANIHLLRIGMYFTGQFDQQAAQTSAYDPATKRLFVVNGASGNVDILDISNPTRPQKAAEIDLSVYGPRAGGVDFHGGVLAVSVVNRNPQKDGVICFFDANGIFLSQAEAGPWPGMVRFVPDGDYVLVANQGVPDDDYRIDPEGSITVVDLTCGPRHPISLQANFNAFDKDLCYLVLDGVRISHFSASVSQDLEPEDVAISPDSRWAYITCQENNTIAVLDILRAKVTRLLPLGLKDWGISRNVMDASDRDRAINLISWPVYSIYMPHGIALYQAKGSTYLVTANEGKMREYAGWQDSVRLGQAPFDNQAVKFNAQAMRNNGALGRLKLVRDLSDLDNDGEMEQVVAFGGRSFSIWDLNGKQMWDSGGQFEQVTAKGYPQFFNSGNKANEFDVRSCEMGVEPRGVALYENAGHTYAFVGLSQIGGIMIYDITNPKAPSFIVYVNNRNFEKDVHSTSAGDLGPDGLLVIPDQDSPTGEPMLVVANQVSGTVTLYVIAEN